MARAQKPVLQIDADEVNRLNARLRLVKQVSAVVCKERDRRGLSRSRVAKTMRVPVSYLTKIEDGRNMTLHTLADVAHAYNSDVIVSFRRRR